MRSNEIHFLSTDCRPQKVSKVLTMLQADLLAVPEREVELQTMLF